jgi:multidrug resistance efflux pump
MERAAAAVTLAQQTYDRMRPLAAQQFASQQKMDEATAALRVAQRSYDQAKFAYDEAVAGFMREEVRMGEAKVARAEAGVQTLKSLVDQMVVTTPTAVQIYSAREGKSPPHWGSGSALGPAVRGAENGRRHCRCFSSASGQRQSPV